MTTINPATDLVLERFVDVPPAKVWEAWTTPEILMNGSRPHLGKRNPSTWTYVPAAGSTV